MVVCAGFTVLALSKYVILIITVIIPIIKLLGLCHLEMFHSAAYRLGDLHTIFCEVSVKNQVESVGAYATRWRNVF
jgi:hypothetical protein